MNIQKVFDGVPSLEVENIMLDSRHKKKNSIFFCKIGANFDGHNMIKMAADNGAVCAVGTRDLSEQELPILYIQVDSLDEAMLRFSREFYGNPSDELNMIGITGTSGKTTTSWVTKSIIDRIRKCGYIGTMGFCAEKKPVDFNFTTPEIPTLHSFLREMREKGCTDCAMEVSSQGLVEHRVDGIDYKTAVFTNLYRDHINYHKSEEAYKEAKKILFRMMNPQGVAIINGDDEAAEEFIKECAGRVVTYGTHAKADYRISDVVYEISRTRFKLCVKGKTYQAETNYIGRFNVYNVVCAIAICCENDCPLNQVLEIIKSLPITAGRMESVKEGQNFNVIVDYAFTPAAYEEVLSFVRMALGNKHRIITVMGPAGNRDKVRRAPCAKICDTYSDVIILTMDDPDGEKTEDILAETVPGIEKHDYQIITDRYEAIKQAIELANRDDLVMILGKGDESRFRMGANVLQPWMTDAAAAKKAIHEIFDL